MSTFVQLQTDLRVEVLELTIKGPRTFQAIYDHIARYVPGYQPIHFQAEILGWIMRGQLFVIYTRDSVPHLTHQNQSAATSRGLVT